VTDAESTPITGNGELTTNDGDDGTYAALNDAALVISGDRVAWTGPASRAPAADRAGRMDGSDQHPWIGEGPKCEKKRKSAD
jgi:hypothetical protein